MRLSAVLLATCALGACVAVNPGPRGPGTIGSAFEGSWKGRGSQSDQPGGGWTIALTLADGRHDSVVGTITYPSLTCGGDLILRNADGGRVELLERITFGDCVDAGVITLTPAGAGLDYAWRSQTDGLTARGTLMRAAPLGR
jgi:hypothetical protein